MIYLPALPTSPADLRARIATLEERRERYRAAGRLTPERAALIAAELRELRSAYAVAQKREGR